MPVRTLGRTTLLVREDDEALAFYRDPPGFQVLFDEKRPDGLRLLHIALAAQQAAPTVGLWLVKAEGTNDALVGPQAGEHPFLVLYTDNCHATVREMEQANVEIRRQPETADGATFAHIADLYGNDVLIVELKRITPFVTQAIPAR